MLSRKDAAAIHHYLISRANADWGMGLTMGMEGGVVPQAA